MKIKHFFWFIIFAPLLVNGQESWTLEKCIQYAFDHNIQIKQQGLNEEYAKNNLTQAKANILPNLNANAGQSYSWGRSVDRYTNTFSEDKTQSNNFSLSSSVTLFNGFQNYNTIQQKKFDLMSAQLTLEKIKNDVALSISSAYLQILYNIEMADITSNQVNITRLQVERTKKLVEAGALANQNLLQVESQLASEELQQVNAENQLTLSYLSLVQMLELDSVEDFKIEKPNFGPIDANATLLTVGQVFIDAQRNLPQIKSAEFSLKSAEIGLSLARGMVSPRLSLSGSYGTGYSDARQSIVGEPGMTTQLSGFAVAPDNTFYDVYSYYPTYNYETTKFNDQIKNNVSKTLSINLSIPLFNGLQTKTAVSNAKISVLNANYSLEQTKKQLLKEIQQAHADATASLKKYKASEKAVTAMDESFKYTQQKFDLGLVNSVDYNTSKNNLIKAKSDFLQSKYEFIFKTKILDFYRGTPIKL